MKKICFMAILITIGVSDFSNNKIFAQENKSKSIPLQAVTADSRFSIENATFYKRLEKATMSLNVNFEVINKSDKDLKLKVYLIAYRKVTAVNNNFRKWIPYPKWRQRDIDKEIITNILLDSIPRLDKNAVDSSVQSDEVFPDFQKYLQYINSNPEIGADLLVKSLNSPTGSAQNGNFPEISIVSQALKTTVFAKLRVPFNPDNLFFNQFAIVITDPEQKKVVASQVFHFDSNFKTF